MLTENFYKVRRDDNSVGIRCDTRFVDDINDDLQYFIDAETGKCCDDGYTRAKLSLFLLQDDGTLIDKIMNFVCRRYGCEMVGDEMQSEHPEQLLQAMMAVYAWIEFKDDEL